MRGCGEELNEASPIFKRGNTGRVKRSTLAVVGG